jgi:hypothetical protein
MDEFNLTWWLLGTINGIAIGLFVCLFIWLLDKWINKRLDEKYDW